MKKLLFALSLSLALLFTSLSAHALTFRASGDYIEAEGAIVSGDAASLVALLKKFPPNLDNLPGVSLNSPGGSLVEGLLLGSVFREYGLTTLVRAGNQCHSACAVAFLGGTRQYTTGRGIGRFLEVGARLGFHGFSSGHERVVLINEAFDSARVLNGLIVGYASEMTGVDLALLSELITVSPTSIRIVNSPRELSGLGISVKWRLPQRPSAWSLNVCTREVDRVRPINDGPIGDRISQASKPNAITNIVQLRTALIDDLYPQGDSRRDALSRLSAEDFVTLVVGTLPKLPVHRISISRGAGLYYDYCYAFDAGDSESNANTLLVSTTGGQIRRGAHGPLAWYPERSPLWR